MKITPGQKQSHTGSSSGFPVISVVFATRQRSMMRPVILALSSLRHWGVSLRRLSSRHRISSIFPHNFTSRSFLDHLVRESEPVLRIFFSPMQRDGRFKRRLCRAFSIKKKQSFHVSHCYKNPADKYRDGILPIQM